MECETTTFPESSQKSSDGPKVSWKEIVNAVQKYRDASITAVTPSIPHVPQPENLPRNVTGLPRQLLQQPEMDITETAAEKLVTLLAEGKLTSVAVVGAFLRRAAVAQKLVSDIFVLI
jgi:hypothetical protein